MSDLELSDLAAARQATVDPHDLYGHDCPECGSVIDRGSLRWGGAGTWEHKDPDSHAQAGHHVFDALAAVAGPGTWQPKAEQNIDVWGQQNAVTLLLAAAEELGEVAIEIEDHTQAGDNPGPTPESDGRRLLDRIQHLGLDVREYLDQPDVDVDDLRIRGDVTDPDAIQQEVDDLAALLYQITWALAQDGDHDG